MKLIASNSPGDVKSTSAPLVIVEEPDDCNQNVKGQGDSIKLAEERAKTYHNALIRHPAGRRPSRASPRSTRR